MTFTTRFGMALALLAAVLPFAAARQDSCEPQHFWYDDRSCCLPYGGPPSPPAPPAGSDCPPDSWYWHKDHQCCVPHNPLPPDCPPPECRNGWDWNPFLNYCQPKPQPSGHHWKRSAKSRSPKPCPADLDACPIAGLTGGDYECLDTSVELESCGGCASTGEGQDCTAIKGAWNVACEQGRCAVYTCSAGFRLSHDHQSCIAL